ncbi:Fic family protein [Gemella haemolysans]|uniref:Fic family protein n=1 Tax=Gemella haemolysans TaxID=1379 RepID=UPI001EF9F71D
MDSLLLIPIFIHDFLCIHPFNDGNGRMSRLLTTLLLYRQGYVIGKYISLERKIEKIKTVII